MLLDEEARKKIVSPARYTLTLEVSAESYATIRFFEERFLLAHVKENQPSERPVQESNWERFLELLPAELRTSDQWRAT